MAKTAARSSSSGRERRIPRLREQVQQAYDLLRDLLGRAGYDRLLAQLEGLDAVDDVLRQRPESIPLLQKAAWELRHEKKFSQLFLNAETGAVVETKDEPIAPCGRTFAQVEQAHLYGSARLFFDRLETAFARKRAREEKQEWKQEQTRKKNSGLAGRLAHSLRELTTDAPTFDPDDYRADYPGYGLYDVLKPHLNHDWQFHLIPLYARLQTRQAEALDELLTFFTDPRELEQVVNLSSEDIAQARGFARAYAEAVNGVSIHGRGRSNARDMDAEAEAARRATAQKDERRLFDLLLTQYVGALGPLREAGGGAEGIVRRLAPIFREDIFALFEDGQALQNAINCPDFILKILGTSTRACPPRVSQALNQIQDKAVTRDLLTMAVESLPAEELEEYMADPKRLPIWNGLPAKFNNNYRYQADAPSESSTLRNKENLRMVADGLFDTLRTGRVEPTGAISGE